MTKNINNKTSSVQGGKIYGDFTSSFHSDIRMYSEDIDVSIAYSKMLKKIGAKYVIIGHSENRTIGETNLTINKKIKSSMSFSS